MAFVDELKVHIEAGRGGDGVVRWLHEKFKEFGGPSGGNGGNGGDVYVQGVRDAGILARYRNTKEFKAERGGDGGNKNMYGKAGASITIDFPVGSLITNKKTGRTIELLAENQKVLLLRGGRGGLGNLHFKSSTNIRPRQATKGKEGESADFLIELQLIADAGLIGLPNAGKSSLLNAITNATAKVGSYQFTTLEPNLGTLYGFILADIPGLIEGASEGKGLGDQFLRHIKRTKALIHCIALDGEDLQKNYETIRTELKAYDPVLLEKKEIIVLTKTDLVTKKAALAAVKQFKKSAPHVFAVSVYDDPALKNFADSIVRILRKIS